MMGNVPPLTFVPVKNTIILRLKAERMHVYLFWRYYYLILYQYYKMQIFVPYSTLIQDSLYQLIDPDF